MSTTLSAQPETGLGAFRDITPGGIPRSREDAVWAAATLGGTLYLAVAGRDVRTVQRFQTSTGKWESAYQKTIRRAKGETEGGLPAMEFVSAESPHGPALYLKFPSEGEPEFLRSSEDGRIFNIVPSHFEDVKAAFSQARDIPTEMPEHPASSQFSLALSLAEKTVVTLNDAVLGCSVWIKGDAWQPALIRGAHRYSDNPEVLAAATWGDSLIFVLGKSGTPSHGKTLPGFEVVRLYPDASWDLLVGAPRVSDQGLKVPLACLAPGMNDFEPSRFCFFTAGKGHLLLGTYDDLAGFRIWRSDDGVDWVAGEAELVGIDRVRAAQPQRIAGGTALILDLDSPQHGQTRSVWIGE